jgi:hypothetical protein
MPEQNGSQSDFISIYYTAEGGVAALSINIMITDINKINGIFPYKGEHDAVFARNGERPKSLKFTRERMSL